MSRQPRSFSQKRAATAQALDQSMIGGMLFANASGSPRRARPSPTGKMISSPTRSSASPFIDGSLFLDRIDHSIAPDHTPTKPKRSTSATRSKNQPPRFVTLSLIEEAEDWTLSYLPETNFLRIQGEGQDIGLTPGSLSLNDRTLHDEQREMLRRDKSLETNLRAQLMYIEVDDDTSISGDGLVPSLLDEIAVRLVMNRPLASQYVVEMNQINTVNRPEGTGIQLPTSSLELSRFNFDDVLAELQAVQAEAGEVDADDDVENSPSLAVAAANTPMRNKAVRTPQAPKKVNHGLKIVRDSSPVRLVDDFMDEEEDEDPSSFTVEELKSMLAEMNVELPAQRQLKQWYVEAYVAAKALGL